MSEAVVLRRMDPGRNMARFYRMDIQADLFGEWCFVREWGRIGQERAKPSILLRRKQEPLLNAKAAPKKSADMYL